MIRRPPISTLFPFTTLFFFNDTATTEIYTLSLHDALPISLVSAANQTSAPTSHPRFLSRAERHSPKRSEEHTSELQSRLHLVCRLLLEKKQKTIIRSAPINKKTKQKQKNK